MIGAVIEQMMRNKVEMYLVRHMNGSIQEVENSGEAEFKVVYDRGNTGILWSISIIHDAFVDFVPLNLRILEKEQSDFYKAVLKLIKIREGVIPFEIPKQFEPDDVA